MSLKLSLKKIENRLALLKIMSEIVETNISELAGLEATDCKKEIEEASASIRIGLGYIKYAEERLKTIVNTGEISGLYPVGKVLIIVPWNYPLLVLFERLPFAVAAGNDVIIKPSEFAERSILRFVELLKTKTELAGAIDVQPGPGAVVGRNLVKDDEINMVVFTGSTKVGRQIAITCAQKFKKFHLELGGKNPLIIDEELFENEQQSAIKILLENANQACIAASRLIINTKWRKHTEQFLKELTAGKKYTLSNENQTSKYHSLARMINTKPVIGNYDPLNVTALFYNISDVPLDLRDEEFFCPIFTLDYYEKFEDALGKANDTKYGLSAYLFSRENAKIEIFLNNIKAGRLWINSDMSALDISMSIQGTKASGNGSEAGPNAILNYSVIKSINIRN